MYSYLTAINLTILSLKRNVNVNTRIGNSGNFNAINIRDNSVKYKTWDNILF